MVFVIRRAVYELQILACVCFCFFFSFFGLQFFFVCVPLQSNSRNTLEKNACVPVCALLFQSISPRHSEENTTRAIIKMKRNVPECSACFLAAAAVIRAFCVRQPFQSSLLAWRLLVNMLQHRSAYLCNIEHY